MTVLLKISVIAVVLALLITSTSQFKFRNIIPNTIKSLYAFATKNNIKGVLQQQTLHPRQFVKQQQLPKDNLIISGKDAPDPHQLEAITCSDPACLIIAGPGSGKTRVLASRLAHILLSGQCVPNEILLLSFTNSAARELKSRAEKMLINSVATTNGVICNTFHGFCKSVICKYMSLTPYASHSKSSYGESQNQLLIVDESDQIRIMLSLMQLRGLPSNPILCNRLLRQIRYWKECGLTHTNIRRKDLSTSVERQAYEMYPMYQGFCYIHVHYNRNSPNICLRSEIGFSICCRFWRFTLNNIEIIPF